MKRTNTVLDLGLDYQVLSKYIDLERKINLINKTYLESSKPLNTRDFSKISLYIDLLYVSLDRLFGELSVTSNRDISSRTTPYKHINSAMDRILDTKRIRLMESMETILEHLIKLQERGESNVISIARGLGFCAPHIGINQGSWNPRFV